MQVSQSTAEGLRRSFPEVTNLGDLSEIPEEFAETPDDETIEDHDQSLRASRRDAWWG